MTKIIFLDIDGVLNTSNEMEDEIIYKVEGVGEHYPINSRCVGLLNDLIASTGAKIVLSSTWRLGLSLKQIKTLLDAVGIKGECIGMTDHLKEYYIFRGNEILKWIKDNKSIVGDYWAYTSYVILDDDTDMLFWQKDNYVNIDHHSGLTDRGVAIAKGILNKTWCEDIGQ